MYLSRNLRFLRNQKGMTQEELSQELGVKRTMISAYEDGRSDPKLPSLEILSKVFDIGLDELLFWDIPKEGRKYLQRDKMKVLSVSLDPQEKEMIGMVGQKASAGYLNGFADPEYMGQLPHFRLPNLPDNRTYRAFEITGDSMLPLHPGTLIIGSYVESGLEIKNGKTYVLITRSEGVVYKRVFNYIEERGRLFLVSDNELYKPYEVPISEVLEIWEAKAYISTRFPDPKEDSAPITLEEIGKMIRDLRAEILKTK
ncbi:helix-turn-helix domain-containing protein [Negadavirga shengliensis]|uniref:Helix-turn-helix domain-containing protein n=1 Tax=Negadavirga shengliensis TaxID=1389218 RepID=A0ABV9T3Z3_9BACT